MNNFKELAILIVEDNEIALEVLSEMIKAINHTVDMARTGEEALSMASEKRYDLIFMDIGLPDIDGIDVTAKIRASESIKSQQAVIIGATSCDVDDVHQDCMSAGMNKVVHKPIPFAHLLYFINQCRKN